jgi:hypothetical protein
MQKHWFACYGILGIENTDSARLEVAVGNVELKSSIVKVERYAATEG